MDKTKRFFVVDPAAKDPIIFDQIFAEKVGGGIVKNHAFDLYPGMAISADGYAVKAYKVVEDAASDATSIKIAKNSGIAVNDILGTGDTAVKCTAVDKETSTAYDIVTVSMGVALTAGTILYQSLAAARAQGYEPCESSDEGALKAVSSDAGEGEILIASCTPWYGTGEAPAANSYVKVAPAVKGSPKYTPKYLLGTFIEANSGDELVKLVNGANVRKETAPVADELVALMPGITKI